MTITDQGQFEEARRLREQGNLAGAQRVLEELATNQPTSAALYAVLGDVYWEQESLDAAISSFRTATRIAPQSEAASLGLFHTLWQEGREDEAFDEMRRFTNLCKSDEYRELIQGINGSHLG